MALCPVDQRDVPCRAEPMQPGGGPNLVQRHCRQQGGRIHQRHIPGLISAASWSTPVSRRCAWFHTGWERGPRLMVPGCDTIPSPPVYLGKKRPSRTLSQSPAADELPCVLFD